MNMVRLGCVAVLASIAWSGVHAGDGKVIFDNSCATCHFSQRDPSKRDEMVAPPIDMMSARLRQLTDDDRQAFVARVVDYVKAPAEAKSADLMAIQRFGLMPSISDTFPDLNDADLRAVAEWMFDAHASVRLPRGMGAGMRSGQGRGPGSR